jgi:pimeloyl-ACP methyl ester carboxylesterase
VVADGRPLRSSQKQSNRNQRTIKQSKKSNVARGARPDGEGRTFNFFPDLAKIQCPTLVLGGEEDPMIPIEAQEDIVAALPAHLVRFERFSNCGHSVINDSPDRAFAVICSFIGH